MIKLQEICNLEFAEKVLQENINVDDLIETLVLRAHKEAPNIKSQEELEGKSIQKGDAVLLKQCPMVKVINEIKEKNFQKTGKREFPDFYKKIIQRYIEKYPDEAAVLHPFCIVHQAMREIIGASKDFLIRQIACRSADGKIVMSKNGLKAANLTADEVKAMIEKHACLYLKKHFGDKKSKGEV